MGEDSIDSAEIRDGVVRVVERSRVSFGVGLQAYYPVWGRTSLRSSDRLPLDDPQKQWTKHSETGIGPYLSVSLAGGDIIDTFGVGAAFSVQRKEGGVRLGFGIVFDPDARHLAADYREDRLAPTGATEVEYVRESTLGGQIMLMFTPGFGE